MHRFRLFFSFFVAAFLTLSISAEILSAPAQLKEELKYAYGFDDHSVNFRGAHAVFDASNKNYLVFVNFHTDMLLNTSNQFDPTRRTLQWQTPYAYASHEIHNFTAIHDKLALSYEWTHGKTREFATFVIVPLHKEIIFKFGDAALQKDNDEKQGGIREGGGLQLRMLNIPEGSIVVTVRLNANFQLQDLLDEVVKALAEKEKDIDCSKVLRDAQHFSLDDFEHVKVLHVYQPKDDTTFERIDINAPVDLRGATFYDAVAQHSTPKKHS